MFAIILSRKNSGVPLMSQLYLLLSLLLKMNL